jgi:hypothetical protein
VNAKETDLFRKFSLLLLDRNKQHSEELKEKLSMYANVTVDSSGMIRAIIEYLHDHQSLLAELVPYILKSKGFYVLEEFNALIEAGKSFEEIEKEIGISVEWLEELKQKGKI